jgi:tRNA (guanine37-N1)-methyltransferase
VTFHVLTIFPDFFQGPFEHGVVARAREAGKVEIRIHNLRDWTHDRHKTVDDRPFGGGEGMLLKPEPLFAAVETIFPERARGERDPRRRVILLSAQGRKFDQAAARRLGDAAELLLICGRYEGVDERVAEHLADDELAIGDYVLSGGELAALVITDVVARFIPGVVGDDQSVAADSFSRGLLDFPQYTRPAEISGSEADERLKVPDVLLSGNHAEIRRWRKRESLTRTLARRPELLNEASLDEEEQEILRELVAKPGKI